MHFTWFDTAVVIIIGLSIILGTYKGVIGIIIGLISFISSVFLSYYLYPYIEISLLKYIEDEIILKITSASCAYLTSFIVCYLIGYKIKSLLSTKNFLDRFLGFIIGFIRGVTINIMIFSVVIIISSGHYIKAKNLNDILTNLDQEKYPKWLKKSLSFKYLSIIYSNIINILPEKKLKAIKILNQEEKKDFINMIEESKKSKEIPKKGDNGLGANFEIELD